MGYDFSKKFMDVNAMDEYVSIVPEVSKKYGSTVKAMALSNREYQHRFDKLSASRAMQSPPSSGRIFSGYLVVRNLGKSNQYETWIPEDGFIEVYKAAG